MAIGHPAVSSIAIINVKVVIVNIRWVLKQHFVGHPKPEDFDLVEEELPPLQDRQFRFKNQSSFSIIPPPGFTRYFSLLTRTCGLTPPGLSSVKILHHLTLGHYHQDDSSVHNDWVQRCRSGGKQAPQLPRWHHHRHHGRLGRARHRRP